MLKAGKRYWFNVNNYEPGKVKSGLFTGKYSSNGNAILMSKNGETWSIPPDVVEMQDSMCRVRRK